MTTSTQASADPAECAVLIKDTWTGMLASRGRRGEINTGCGAARRLSPACCACGMR